MKTLLFSLLAISMFMSSSIQAAVLLNYTFATDANPTNTAANVTGTTLTVFGSGASATVPSAQTGSNVNQGTVTGLATTSTGTFSAGNVFRVGMGSATRSLAQATATSSGLPTSTQYSNFTLNADTGFQFTLDTLTVDFSKGNTSGDRGFALFYSTDNFTTSSSLLGSYVVPAANNNTNFTHVSFDLSGIPVSTSLAFRFNFIQSASSLTANYDNLILNGTVAAIPEPSTYALLGFGLGILWLLRRKKAKADAVSADSQGC